MKNMAFSYSPLSNPFNPNPLNINRVQRGNSGAEQENIATHTGTMQPDVASFQEVVITPQREVIAFGIALLIVIAMILMTDLKYK